MLVFAAEFLGPVGLVVGFLSRPAAAGIAAVMIGALFFHFEHGFFMNWSGSQAAEGFEYHLLAIALSLAVAFKGSGALSLDRWLVA